MRLLLALFLATLASARPASAAEAVRFTYDAPAGCPDQSAFMERVRVRAEHLKVAIPGEPAVAFAVLVTANASESTARVEFLDTNSERVARTVRGGSCTEVVAAIALVTAMAIEAHAVVQNEPLAPSTTPPQTWANVATRESAAPPALKSTKADDHGWGLGATGAIVAESGLSNASSVAVYGERIGRTPFRVLTAALGRARADASLHGRDATFVWWTAQVALCPFGLVAAQGLEFEACAGGEVGALTGEGQKSSALPAPLTKTIGWGAALSSLRVRLTLENFLVMQLSGQAGFPLVRYKFRFDDPHEVVFDIPPVRLEAALSAGFRF